MRRIRTHHKHPKGRIFAWMVLLMTLGLGIIQPIFPHFVKIIVRTDVNVSIFYSAMALAMLLGAVLSTVIFSRLKRATIVKFGFLITGIAYLTFIFISKVTELAILTTIRIWFTLFLLMALSLFVRDFAREEKLGEEEGVFYRFHNLGYLIGPILGGFIAGIFNYEIAFITAAAIFIAGLLFFYRSNFQKEHPSLITQNKTTTLRLLKNISLFFTDPGRVKAYLITFGMMLWYGFKRLYIPLYIVLSGFMDTITGIVLALCLVPHILLEVKVGEYADKKGIHIPITCGFLIMAFALTIVYISPYPSINLIILILVNIGSGLIEPLQEVCLFKNLPKKEEDNLYGVYMTADPVAYFIAPLIGTIVLMTMPFNSVFLIFGILFLLFAIYSNFKLKHL